MRGGGFETTYGIIPVTQSILEKMPLTAGITCGGRKPATTIATAAAINAYSIMS